MKTRVISFAVMIATIGLMSNATAQAEVKPTGARINVDKEVHDYGTINTGANGICFFKVTNTGDEPLIISLCKGSCSCTVSDCPKEPIAPGASVNITVTYNTTHIGPINKSVTITSNATNEPSKVVRITGNVVSVIYENPEPVHDFITPIP